MKYIVFVISLFLLSLLYSCTTDIQLVENQKSNYIIVIPTEASPYEHRAAEVLQKYFKDRSDVELEIIDDNEPATEYEILVGNNKRFNQLNIGIDFENLEENGFTIQTIGNKLIIAGGSHKGSLYGVYTFLEDYLGCKMYTPYALVIPQSN